MPLKRHLGGVCRRGDGWTAGSAAGAAEQRLQPHPVCWTVRYYSPEAEISFCGHATIASGVARLAYDFDALTQLMLDDGLTTVQLVWRERPALFHARDPLPVGGAVEDPATGAAVHMPAAGNG